MVRGLWEHRGGDSDETRRHSFSPGEIVNPGQRGGPETSGRGNGGGVVSRGEGGRKSWRGGDNGGRIVVNIFEFREGRPLFLGDRRGCRGRQGERRSVDSKKNSLGRCDR